ncbi:hypothetical protein FQZ97_1052330 [compost metagenome]
MQHRAGQVEQPPHATALRGGEAFPGTPGEHRLGQFQAGQLALASRFAQLIEQAAQGFQQGFAAIALLQGGAGRGAQQAVHRG